MNWSSLRLEPSKDSEELEMLSSFDEMLSTSDSILMLCIFNSSYSSTNLTSFDRTISMSEPLDSSSSDSSLDREESDEELNSDFDSSC